MRRTLPRRVDLNQEGNDPEEPLEAKSVFTQRSRLASDSGAGILKLNSSSGPMREAPSPRPTPILNVAFWLLLFLNIQICGIMDCVLSLWVLSLPNSNPDLFHHFWKHDGRYYHVIMAYKWPFYMMGRLATYLFWAFPYSPNGSPAIPPSPVKMYKYPSSAKRSCPPLWFDAGSSISRMTLEGRWTTI